MSEADKNGELLGIELHPHRGGFLRLRLVYPGGAVTHILPRRLVSDFGRSVGRLEKFLRSGDGKSWSVGKWWGPE
jgi:hypothetical protein